MAFHIRQAIAEMTISRDRGTGAARSSPTSSNVIPLSGRHRR
jgi:hypothetical protein